MVIERSRVICEGSIRGHKKASLKRNYYWLSRHLQDVITPCNRCNTLSTGQQRDIHHKDYNPHNDSFDNFELLCVSCHRLEHGNKTLQKCYYCGTRNKGRKAKYCKNCNHNKSKIGKYCITCNKGFDSFKCENVKYCSKSCACIKYNKTKIKYDHEKALVDFEQGMLKSQIAKKYGVSPSTITKLTRNFCRL